jgi:two-component system phosphate regulon sensor histidine kinase PhoR
MRTDLLRVLGVVAGMLIPGLWFGHPFMFVALGLTALGIWYFRAFERLLQCVRNDEEEGLPDVPGLVNELAREFHLARSYHEEWERKLSSYLVQFRDAASALPDAVVVTDQNGRIKWANERARTYLGIEFPRDAGQTIMNLVRHPELARALTTPPALSERRMLEMPSPQSEDLQLEVRIARYGDADTLFVARDVTESQRLLRMRRDFIANASHELRTPLTVIAGYLEAFDEELEHCPPDWVPKVRQMRGQALRMQRLISDLLQLSALESAADENPSEEVPVGDLILAVQKEAQGLSGTAAHRIAAVTQPDLWLSGSQRDIYSVISNIVTNAVHHTPPGGSIKIRWYMDERGAHLEVADQGEGIPAEHLPRLTERFYRVDKGRSRAYGGTGLGLAIVKHALARHDATLEIQSESGKGSTFTCHFPTGRILPPQRIRKPPAAGSA